MLRSDASEWNRDSRNQADSGPPEGRGAAAPEAGRTARLPGRAPGHGQPDGRPGGEAGAPAVLAQMVESEIIPRLLLNCRSGAPVAACSTPDWVRPDGKDVDMLASSAVGEDASQLLAQVEAQLARGISPETMLLDVLAPAARLLGEWWEQDACDFIDVTMGLWRLQEVVHELSGRVGAPLAWGANCRTALFATMPGDDHAFGSLLVEETFRNAGWASRGARGLSRAELVAAVREQHVDLVALTANSSAHAIDVKSLIADMRAASPNPSLIVMVGGWLFCQDAGLAMAVGADATSADAREAVRMADELMQDRVRQSIAAVGIG